MKQTFEGVFIQRLRWWSILEVSHKDWKPTSYTYQSVSLSLSKGNIPDTWRMVVRVTAVNHFRNRLLFTRTNVGIDSYRDRLV